MSKFCRWPRELNPAKGYTAYSPESAGVGQALQRSMNHLINWRYNGLNLCTNWRYNATTNDATGKFYPIMHYPPQLDSTDRGLAIGWALWGNPANGAWSLQFEDAVAGYAQEDIVTGDNDANVTGSTFSRGCYTTIYEPPSGGAVNLHQGNFKALEMETTNVYVASLTAWHIESDSDLDSDLVPVSLNNVAAGKVISEKAKSLQGLYEIVGTGADNVTSIERCGRGVFYNEAHPTGISIVPASAWGSIFTGAGGWEYPARARLLSQCDTERYCYPAFVITTDGVGGGATCQLRVTSDCAADNVWIYEIQDAEPDNTPYIITPMMAGSDDANGVRVETAVDDSILIEAQTDGGVTLTIHSWGLFEGPAW